MSMRRQPQNRNQSENTKATQNAWWNCRVVVMTHFFPPLTNNRRGFCVCFKMRFVIQIKRPMESFPTHRSNRRYARGKPPYNTTQYKTAQPNFRWSIFKLKMPFCHDGSLVIIRTTLCRVNPLMILQFCCFYAIILNFSAVGVELYWNNLSLSIWLNWL